MMLGWLLATFLFMVAAAILWKRKKSRSLPPGPSWALPLLGYLPFLSMTQPHLQLEDMKKRYGNVFGMYLGSKYTLFLCDLESAKEALNKDEFSDRPEGAFQISQNFQHFASMNGQQWRDHRKLCSRSLRHLGVGTETLADCARIQVSLDFLEKEAASSGNRDVNFRKAISIATTNITCGMICGKTFPPEHRVFKVIQDFLKFFAENGTAISLDTFLPWLKPVLDALVASKVAKHNVFLDLEKVFWEEIEAHEKKEVGLENKDFLDFYLQERMKPGNGDKFARGEMNGNAQLMIFAGADTVRASVEWFLLCMALFPDVQDTMFAEIQDVLGTDGTPRYEERSRLPYTEAAILESMRYATIAPINPIHCNSKETKFRGWVLPAGSIVLASLYSIHHDPDSWPNPEHFDPKRFLTPDAKSVRVPEAFVPFSIGKRICIGDKMALIETFLLSVSLLQRFRILPPDGGVTMEGTLRVNLECKSPCVKLLSR